jgi:hypothetical protein
LGVVCAVGWIAWCGGGFLAWCGSTHIKRRPRACGGWLAASFSFSFSFSEVKVQPVALFKRCPRATSRRIVLRRQQQGQSTDLLAAAQACAGLS